MCSLGAAEPNFFARAQGMEAQLVWFAPGPYVVGQGDACVCIPPSPTHEARTMPDKTIAVAEFATAAEAHLALGLLQQHAIQGFVSDDTTNPLNFSLLGRMPYAPGIWLHVPEAQAAQARQLLQVQTRPKPPRGWKKQAEQVKGWLCSLCGSYHEEDGTTCPDCGEPRQTRPGE
jgi:hypothetical protein